MSGGPGASRHQYLPFEVIAKRESRYALYHKRQQIEVRVAVRITLTGFKFQRQISEIPQQAYRRLRLQLDLAVLIQGVDVRDTRRVGKQMMQGQAIRMAVLGYEIT